MSNENQDEIVQQDAPASEQDDRDLSMGVTSAGDPIAPNSYARTGALNNIIGGAIGSVSALVDLSANVLNDSAEAAAGLTTDSAARINDLAQQLLDELNKAQQKIL